MAKVLSFPSPRGDPLRAPALNRVRQLSRPLIALFVGLFWVTAATAVVLAFAVLMHDGPRLQVRDGTMLIRIEPMPPPLAPGWQAVGDLPLVQRAAMVGSGLLMIGPALGILWALVGLFRLYAAGVVLEARNASRMNQIGWWSLAYAAGPALGHLLVEAAGFQDRGWLRLDSLQALALGLVVLVIARVMRMAAELRTEAESFV